MLILSFCRHAFCFLYNGKFAVIVYNAKVIFIIQYKHVSFYYLPWFAKEAVMCLAGFAENEGM